MICLHCNLQGDQTIINQHCPVSPNTHHVWTEKTQPFKFYKIEVEPEKKEAIRVSHPIRYDILDPLFLEDLARIADYGAKKYGDLNWQISRLTGDKSPINHIYKHLKSYRLSEPYDHDELGKSRRLHLVAIAFNAMMEYYWVCKEELENSKDKG